MEKKYKKEIKCPLCSGKAVLVRKEMKLFGGDLILKETPFYKCQKCRETFATSKQVSDAEKKLRKGFFFRRKIISTGGSLAITLPSDLSDYYKLDKGQEISLIPDGRNTLKIITKK